MREVILFKAGIAEITRFTGESRDVVFRVPLRDVSDVIESLVARGEGVTGLSLSLAGETPVEDAFAVLPFRPEAATNLASLLNEVPGVRVRVSETGDPEGEVGTVMGVQDDCSGTGGCKSMLTVLGEDGTLRWHTFGEGLTVAILDAEIAEALPRGLDVLREAASGMVRDIAVAIEGEDPNEGRLTYVIAAPPWKASYRALTGPGDDVEFQALAVVQNATGEDWESVRLTLSSGSPQTLSADLHARGPQFDLVPEAPAAVEPEDAAAAAAGFLGMQFGTAEELVDRLAPQPPPPIGAAGPTGDESTEARFVLKEPVDLGAGQMLSAPFLANGPEARHLSVWTGAGQARAGHPEMVLEVTNNLDVRLPSGVVTVLDEAGGYLGDVGLPFVDPGSSVARVFGSDMGLHVEEIVLDEAYLLTAGLRGGMLHATFEQVHEAGYRATSSSGESRDVVIDHPMLEGWTLEVIEGPDGSLRQDETGQGWMRFGLPVATDGAHLVLRQTRTTEDSHPVSHMNSDEIRVWADRVPSDEDRAVLLRAAQLVERMNETGGALRGALHVRDELLREQERVRQLLDTVPRLSAAHDRFTRGLLDLEERIAAAEAAIEAAETVAQEASDAVFSMGRTDDKAPGSPGSGCVQVSELS